MTKRQHHIAGIVAKRRADVVAVAMAELSDKPVGYSACVRLFYDFRYGPLAVFVTKEPQGFVWAHHDPCFYGRKGYARPKMRPL